MIELLNGLKEELEATPHKERVQTLIHCHIDKLSCRIHESRLTFHEAKSLPPEHWKILREKRKEFHRLLVSSIESYLKYSHISQDSLKIATYSLLGMTNWIMWWYDPKGLVSPYDLSEEIYNIFVGNFLPKNEKQGGCCRDHPQTMTVNQKDAQD